ncbi:hypothetical protein GGI12_003729 [Dipsacomyces acuminosporus]|nr:hypothetical protein GGI12_003729 [Dipsacomyces acuminosporus]
MKKQRTAETPGTEPDVETLALQLALAGPSLSLENISSISGAGSGGQGSSNSDLVAGLAVQRGDSENLPDVYVEAENSSHNSFMGHAVSRTSTAATSGNASDSDEFTELGASSRGKYASKYKGGEGDRFKERDGQRRLKERRERDRGASSATGAGGGDVFSIDDVIGYTGVDLREESEMILSTHMHPSTYRRAANESYVDANGPSAATHVVGGVEITRDRSLGPLFANQRVLELMIAKICKRAHIRAVSADVAPYISFALKDRLRSFMELVSAAAYHRTRTQTLPPPPLDPLTRLPLYRITPHLDIKKQLAVIERIDQIREEAREQLLSEREQNAALDQQQEQQSPEGGDGLQAGSIDERKGAPGVSFAVAANGSGSGADTLNIGASDDQQMQPAGNDGDDQSKGLPPAKRQRKKDDGAGDTPAYTNKNMPEDVRNRISNQTALRAAGGIRKSWMNASTPDWLLNASASKASSRTNAGAKPQPSELNAERAVSIQRVGSSSLAPLDTASASHGYGHKRNRSSADTPVLPDSAGHLNSPGPDSAAMSPGVHLPSAQSQRPPPLLSHRSTSLAAPLLITVRDCLFSLERERLGNVRVAKGGGERVLIQAYSKYVHD